MKIGFHIFHYTHGFASVEHLFNELKSKGHTPLLQLTNEQFTPWSGDIDIIIRTTERKDWKLPKGIKSYFIPHGMGKEYYSEDFYRYDKVLLNGNFPYLENWNGKTSNVTFVGWSKSDILWKPEKEKVQIVKKEIDNLLYDRNILFWSALKFEERLDYLLKYCKKNKLNLIAPIREDESHWSGALPILKKIKKYRKIKYFLIPKLLNLYYYTPYLDLVLSSGKSSIGKEFYITNLPVVSPYDGNPEIITMILKSPEKFICSKKIISDYFKYKDGKATERIIKEIGAN